MRLIDAEPIIEKLENAIYLGKRIDEDTANLEAVLADIEAQPAELSEYSDKLWKTAYERGKAEALPKEGVWMTEYDTHTKMLACSACGGRVIYSAYTSAVGMRGYAYCPYCGARMEESDG